jgi:hypothetical protein
MSEVTGTVRELWRWPVKGMGGERMPSVRVDGRGVGGDRTHAVLRLGEHGWEPARVADVPKLAAWTATYPFNIGANVDPVSPPYALVESPRGRSYVWNDPRLRCALEDDLGERVQMRRDLHGLQLVDRTILVTWGDADPRALRANVHLDGELDVDRARSVLGFQGGVRLRLLCPCTRGGVYARVLSNGRVAVGGAVLQA